MILMNRNVKIRPTSLSLFTTFELLLEEEKSLELLLVGKRSRFNRTGFVSLFVVGVGVDAFDERKDRLVIEGAEQGKSISIFVFAEKKTFFVKFR